MVTARVAVPDGLQACPGSEPRRTYVWWHGSPAPTQAARALARGLHDAHLAPAGSDLQGSAFLAVPGLPGSPAQSTPLPISF
ncbi:hypothetical protein [Angustibacter sp. Root456]|uniref:hypothetical protein n=1 Tax=Angustibacter sp. Root456 TaxID=1736539 RepID=UPI000701362E|nr:hypothetical protein [Angustibacter sp. Root456]KQX66181.1 hypothetical protein ASD06_07330 [Angustibacter sp. Root456]